MRTVTYGAACSLDGFIAGKDGAIDWLHFSQEVQDVMTKYWETADTILMGRKTWEVAVAMSGGSGGAEAEGAPPKLETYVFSRTLRRIDQPGVTLVSDNAGEFVRNLKSKKGKGICVMGGGDFARSLFDAGVIDEIGLNIHPILLGSGVPFFLDAGKIGLELLENRTLSGGCVLVGYRVKNSKRRARE